MDMTWDVILRLMGAAAGLLVGILFLTIGFWKTLLLVALGCIGWLIMGSSQLLPSVIVGIFKKLTVFFKRAEK